MVSHKELKEQIESLRNTLDSLPLNCDDCSQEQWQQRLHLQDEVADLEQAATNLNRQALYLGKDILRLSTLLNADKQIAANSKRDQELATEIARLRDGVERVHSSITDIETKHEGAAKSADMALQIAVQARARATATGDIQGSTAAEKSTQEATAASQLARQAKKNDEPLLTALRAEAEAIDAQILNALAEQGIARGKVREFQVAKLEDAWDQKAQELVTIGNQLVNLDCREAFRSLKIPNLAERGRSIHYGDLLDDSSVLHG